MNDGEIDDLLKQAAEAHREVDPELLKRVTNSIGSSFEPVRPLPPSWALTTVLALICMAVGGVSAAGLGLFGVHKLSGLEAAVIFPALVILIWLSANTTVSEMIPGSRRLVWPGTLLGAGCLALISIFGILFHDYETENFLSQGIVCLRAGLLLAIPTALASWLILRRGFAVNPIGAGLAAGTLAGLAGVTMLELHCANLEAPHVMLWHTAVMALSAAGGALLLRFIRRPA